MNRSVFEHTKATVKTVIPISNFYSIYILLYSDCNLEDFCPHQKNQRRFHTWPHQQISAAVQYSMDTRKNEMYLLNI